MSDLMPLVIFALVGAGAYLLLIAFTGGRAPRQGLDSLIEETPKDFEAPAAWSRESLEQATRGWRRFDLYRGLDMRIRQAGLPLKPVEFVLACLAGLLVVAGIAWLFTHSKLQTGAIVLIMLAAIPMGLQVAIVQRMRKFESQLPDALELMAAALRAGHGFQRAMHVTADEMPDPICSEFRTAVQDIGVGRTVEDALNGILRRVPSYEMELIATAVAIQLQVGGNLSEILQKIAETLRERARIRGEIQTLTAEGRLSAWVIFLLPIFMFFYLNTTNPGYMKPLTQTEIGHLMIIVAVVMQSIGMFIIWRMLSMEV